MLSVMLAAQAADPSQRLLVQGAVIVVVCFLLVTQPIVLAKFYRIPPPNVAIVRTGHGGLTVSVGSGLLVIPMCHFSTYLNLAVQRFDLTGTQLDSDQARWLQLPNVFQVAVGRDEDMLRCAAERLDLSTGYTQLVMDIVCDEYERLLAQLDDNPSGDSPANRFIDGVEEALNAVGLTIIACRRQQNSHDLTT